MQAWLRRWLVIRHRMILTIGKGAHVSVWNGVTGKNINGDIAVGPNAHAWNGEYSYGSEGRIGSKEYLLDFGQGGVVGAESFFGIPYKYKVADGSKVAGSIAIGKNTVARTGSVMLGDHSYTGKLGDIEINPASAMTYNDGIYSTTLGAGAYNSGSLAAVTGALSIASGEDTQNTGATIYGSMNSIESATSSSSYSGVASSVLGFANRTQNANAALIWGTGNEVTNSVEDIGIDTKWNKLSVAEAQQKAIEAMQSSKYAGGSVMAIGGGNKADYATYSQLTGVQNKVTGTKTKAAKYDFVNGYQNTVTKASDVTVIGSKNEVTADGNKVIGDNHKVSGKNNVIFGSADKLTETTVHNSVALGHNSKVTGEGGVALGFGSVADRGNAVSVGNAKLNRQITNVAEGVEDTDAVNVSQLKKATANANKGWKLSTEGDTANQVASEATVDFSGKKDAGGHQNITVSNEGNNVKIELASELKNVTGVVNGNSRVTLGTGIAGITNGQESVIMKNGSTTINGVVGIDKNGKITGVAAGEVSSTSTDAINGSQLHQTNENVAQNKADIAANRADIDKNKADIAANRADIDKNKADIAANRADIDKNKADIAQNKADIAQNKADIAQNKADIAQNKTDIKNLGDRVTNVEELAKKHTTVTAGDNITVTEDTNKDGGKEYKVALDKDIKLDSVTTGQTVMNNDGLKVGDKVSVTKDAVTAGKTSISDEGVKVGDKTYISDKGLNANGQQITNVADGKENSDAVNYGQLKGVENQVVSNTNRINQLGSRVNKVGAGAAALAALHPMDFDPDDKLTFSAGYGNYGGENAAAIGAYYRPDEKVMFSVGGTVGNGENMVNAGVSFSLDRTNHVSNSRTAMAREILDLRAEVTELKAMVAKGGLGSIAEDKMKIFPDVAENHWAYEYVGKLAAAGIIEGYPDGKFSGDRMMSRYEFAAMLYRAMQKGAQLDSKIINEFAPEMGRIRVDRISGEDGDRDKIERVRVNAVKGERDHYGNKVAKKAAK